MSFTLKIDEVKLSEISRHDRILKRTLKQMSNNEESLLIEGGSYHYYNWQQILKNNHEISSETLSLKRNYEPNIIYQILHVKMPHLLQLNLSSNHIVSIEPLCALDAPNLKRLFLRNQTAMKKEIVQPRLECLESYLLNSSIQNQMAIIFANSAISAKFVGTIIPSTQGSKSIQRAIQVQRRRNMRGKFAIHGQDQLEIYQKLEQIIHKEAIKKRINAQFQELFLRSRFQQIDIVSARQ